MRRVSPRYVTGGNGVPGATIARPAGHRIASAAGDPLFLLGVGSGKTNKRSLIAAIAVTTPSVKTPAVPEVPIRIVGLKLPIVSSRVMRVRSRHSYAATSTGDRA